MRDVVAALGAALKKVLTTQSSYINGPDVDYEAVAAQLMLQTEGVSFLTTEAHEMLVANMGALDLDEPVPFTLTEKGGAYVSSSTG